MFSYYNSLGFKRKLSCKIISFAKNKDNEAIALNINFFEIWFSFTTCQFEYMFF